MIPDIFYRTFLTIPFFLIQVHLKQVSFRRYISSNLDDVPLCWTIAFEGERMMLIEDVFPVMEASPGKGVTVSTS